MAFVCSVISSASLPHPKANYLVKILFKLNVARRDVTKGLSGGNGGGDSCLALVRPEADKRLCLKVLARLKTTGAWLDQQGIISRCA